MHHSINRRQFLRGDLAAKRTPIRPPWALAEAAFSAACTRCMACLSTCPERLIKNGSGGYPELDFSAGGCSFCGACVVACESGALHRTTESLCPWILRAVLDSGCLTLQGVVCRSCSEHCEAGAIRFQLQHGAVAAPGINAQQCTGCGACIAVCPTHALTLRTPQFGEEPPHSSLSQRERGRTSSSAAMGCD